MSDVSNLQDDFKLVKYKNNFRKHTRNTRFSQDNNTNSSDFDKKSAIRRITAAKEDLLQSDLFASFRASLREGLSVLNNPVVKEIVCFGLGKFGECMTSRYQLALLCSLKDIYEVKVKAYDPVFGRNEREVLEELEITVLDENCEAKYESRGNEGLTVFYLPHCPKQLTNNLIWSNWCLRLSNCMIIANSFNKTIETNTRKCVNSNAGYLFAILPYVVELAVINTFKYFDIFNDTAIHVFPIDKLSVLPKEFWTSSSEPVYNKDDLEFITNKLIKL